MQLVFEMAVDPLPSTVRVPAVPFDATLIAFPVEIIPPELTFTCEPNTIGRLENCRLDPAPVTLKMALTGGMYVIELKTAVPAFWMVTVFPDARLKLLPLAKNSVPPSIVTLPLAFSAPVFAPL